MASVVRVGLLAAVIAAAAGDRSAPASGQTAPASIRNPRLGLAHVDVMELHVERRPDAPPAPRDLVPAGDLADRYRQGAASGAAWHRWSLYWDLVDRGGTFDWTVGDGIVARDVGHGLTSLLVLHGNQPGVARVEGAPGGIDAPIFVRADGTTSDDPQGAVGINDANSWARFVAAAVRRYMPGGELGTMLGWSSSAGVRNWQIGNEPNSLQFWRGTPAEFARYLEAAYLAAKWIDPQAVVAHGGIANDANAEAWFGAFLDAIRARAASSPLPARYNHYYDRTAWHWYATPSNLTVGAPWRVRQMHAERGLPAKPLWVTEFGAPVWSEYPGPCWDPASIGRVTVAEQSSFIWQAMAEGLAAGAELMVYFQLFDDCGNGHESYDAFGLVRNHAANQCWTHPGQSCWGFDASVAGSPRPSYEAFRTAARELHGVSLVAAPPEADGWRRIVFRRPGGALVTLAWNTTRRDRSVGLPAASAGATLFEIDGSGMVRARAVTAADGRYLVFLAGATNRNGFTGAPIAAGRPVLLVEFGAAAGGVDGAWPAGASAGASAAASGTAPPGASGPAAVPAAPDDSQPPILAIVGALPESSAPMLELHVLAADASSGLGAFQVFFAVDAPPTSPEGWTPYVTPLPWPGAPKHGEVTLPFVGAPGHDYFFAARASDLAGNWTPMPDYVQALTRIADSSRRPARPPFEPIPAHRDGVAH